MLTGAISAESTVEVLDMQGKVVFQTNAVTNTMIIPTQQWSTGIYLVRLNEGGLISQKKIVKN